jgi:hypothetical protein
MAADISVGTWKLNGAKSKYTSAEQARYETVQIEAVGNDMKVTLNGTDSTGKKVQAEWTGKYDGKDYPVAGSPDIDTLAYTKRSLSKISGQGRARDSARSLWRQRPRLQAESAQNPGSHKRNRYCCE